MHTFFKKDTKKNLLVQEDIEGFVDAAYSLLFPEVDSKSDLKIPYKKWGTISMVLAGAEIALDGSKEALFHTLHWGTDDPFHNLASAASHVVFGGIGFALYLYGRKKAANLEEDITAKMEKLREQFGVVIGEIQDISYELVSAKVEKKGNYHRNSQALSFDS